MQYYCLTKKLNNITVIKVQIAVGWIVSSVVGLAVLYGVYEYNQLSPNAKDMSLVTSVFYGMFQRATWSACLAWLIIACHWGYGGKIINY